MSADCKMTGYVLTYIIYLYTDTPTHVIHKHLISNKRQSVVLSKKTLNKKKYSF